MFRDRCSGDVEFHAIRNLGDLAVVLLRGFLEYSGGRRDIRGSGVGARNKVSLVDWDILGLQVLQGGGNLDGVGTRDVRRKGGKIQEKLLVVLGTLVGAHRVRKQLVQNRVRETLRSQSFEWTISKTHGGSSCLGLQPSLQNIVNGEQTGQSTPLGSHVGDGQSVVHTQAVHSLLGAGELNRVVQDIILVEQTTQSDNDILARHTLGQNTR